MINKTIRLQVSEAYQDDVKKGIVRIDSIFMKELGLEVNDVIQIEGTRKTVAKVKRGYPKDSDKSIIRMDGVIRKNAQVGVDNFVKISRINIREASKVLLIPMQDVNNHPLYIETVFKNLQSKVFVNGDVVVSYSKPNQIERNIDSSNPLDIFELALGRSIGGLTRASNAKFKVSSIEPKTDDALFFGVNTKLEFLEKELSEAENYSISYEDVGGLKEQLTNIRELVDLPLKYPEIFSRLNVEPPKGILLYGPPGTGKTLLAKAIANETQATFHQISAPEVINKYVGESEKRLRDLFDKANKTAPSVIFIDEIDAIASKRDNSEHETEKRVVTQLLTLMDGLNSSGKVIVIAATNRPDTIDGALRRSGRFDREIEIGVPKKEEREEILKIHASGMPIRGDLHKRVIKKLLLKRIDNYIEYNNIEIDKCNNDKLFVDSELSKIKKDILNLNEYYNQENKKLSLKNVEFDLEIDSIKKNIKNIKLTLDKSIEEEKSLKTKKRNLAVKFKKLNDNLNRINGISNLLLDKKIFKTVVDFLYFIGVKVKNKEFNEVSFKKNRDFFIDYSKKYFFNNEILFTNNENLEKLMFLGDVEIVDFLFFIDCEKDEFAVNELLCEIVDSTNGFVGADIAALVKEAAFSLIRREFPNLLKDDSEVQKLQKNIDKLHIKEKDFKEALKVIRPSALREFVVEVPKVRMDEVGGLDSLKQSLKEMIDWPFTHPDAFKRLGIKSPKGVLMYGPPGTGKTLLAKAVATESNSNFIYIKSPDLLEKYSGDTEKKIKNLFKKARQNSPSIIFFDEIDAIASKRMGGDRTRHTDTIVNQILMEIDGLEELVDVKILAATNRPNIIDSALLRPGRFDKLINIKVPDEKARANIINIHLKGIPVINKEGLIDYLIDKTHGFVGADIEALVREAGLIALRRDIKSDKITFEDFDSALEIVKPSVTEDILKYYEDIERNLKSPSKQIEDYSMNSYL